MNSPDIFDIYSQNIEIYFRAESRIFRIFCLEFYLDILFRILI